MRASKSVMHLLAPAILLALAASPAPGGTFETASPQWLSPPAPPDTAPRPNTWGLDILLSNDGFGLGTFYRRDLDPDISLVASLSISESKDPRETEQYDYFGNSFTPGKLNRFLVIPLMFGMQYRLFREDITDTFRPYVNGGVGPTMIYVMPYLNIVRENGAVVSADQVEYFSSIGKGQPHYTAGGFVGFGANFGSERSSVFGVNFRYYFTYLYSSGIPSLIDPNTGDVIATKKSFGGFFITINIGTAF